MRRAHRPWILLPIVLSLGCRQSGDPSASTSSASPHAPLAPHVATPPARDATSRSPPLFGRHAGLTSMLFLATNEVPLTDAERASVDDLETPLRSDDGALHAAMGAFRATVLAGVKAGRIDLAQVGFAEAAVDEALSDHRRDERAALDALYALLDSKQRAAVVAAARARQAERDAPFAYWVTVKEADGGALDWGKRRLDRLTASLSLDARQQGQVGLLLAAVDDPPDAAGMRSRLEIRTRRQEALLEAFSSDTFEARSADLTLLPGRAAHAPMDHLVALLARLLPILRPAQRDRLAASLDQPFGAREGPRAPMGAAWEPLDDVAFPFVEPGEEPAK